MGGKPFSLRAPVGSRLLSQVIYLELAAPNIDRAAASDWMSDLEPVDLSLF
jgi:hypothetical protein